MRAIIWVGAIVLMLFNIISGVAAFVWLAILGDWETNGILIVFTIAGLLMFGILMVPTMILSIPGLAFTRSGHKKLALLYSIVPMLTSYVTVSVFCIFVFDNFVSRQDYGSSSWPYALAGYSATTGTLRAMAAEDAKTGGWAAGLATLFASVGVIVMFVQTANSGDILSITELSIGFSVPIAIGFLIQLVLVFLIAKERGELNILSTKNKDLTFSD